MQNSNEQSEPFSIELVNEFVIVVKSIVLWNSKCGTVYSPYILNLEKTHQVRLQFDELVVFFSFQVVKDWNPVGKLHHIRVGGIVHQNYVFKPSS
jgi:hypothetical protein